VPVGFPAYDRGILYVAYLSVAGLTMDKGYQNAGPGWLLVGRPFAIAFGILAQGAILRAFPPKFEARSEGRSWLKLA
jgi:hypothetical protein